MIKKDAPGKNDFRIKEEDRTQCAACGRCVSSKWNYCPRCGKPISQK